MTPENTTLSVLLEDLNAVTKGLLVDLPGPDRTENEEELFHSAVACHDLSKELAEILSLLKATDRRSRWQSMRVKWWSIRKEKDIESIERRLSEVQSQILIRLHLMMSEESKQQHSAIKSKLDKLQSEAKQLQKETAKHLHALRDEITTSIETLQLHPRPVSATAENKDSASGFSPSLGKISVLLVKLQSVTTSISNENHILQRSMFPSMYKREDNISDAATGMIAWMVDESDNKRGTNRKTYKKMMNPCENKPA